MSGTQCPQIRVEILGADRCGKSVVAQVLRQVLRRELVTVIGPAPTARRHPDELRRALLDLKARGLSVEIVEAETFGPILPKVPIDARIGFRKVA